LCFQGARPRSRARAHKKAACLRQAALNLGRRSSRKRIYGEYVMVRTPAMLPMVIVVPCEKPAGYASFATEFSALT
jgi:hypothetical protein